jgi:hypothetical protein
VLRACDRYLLRGQRARPILSLEDAAECPELTAPSAEAEASARDAPRRAGILDQLATLTEARGDTATATTLGAAATNAFERSTHRA